ncbi:hypothetical protein QF001_003756 [Paraburkholderia youngii]|uniref:phage major capsid family protein n=1 Tax=Paraburkholderia youngii TaxID=2782701 RepID=UPI003D21D981
MKDDAGRYGFIRVARALALARGDVPEARAMLEAHYGDRCAELVFLERAIINVGAIDNPDDVALAGIAENFLALVGEYSIIDRIDEVMPDTFHRVVPYRPVLTGGATTAAWIPEAMIIPMGEAGFEIERIPAKKVAGLLVVTEELARVFAPRADRILGGELARALADEVTRTFLSDDAPSNASPGGIFYGASEIAGTGDIGQDVVNLLAEFTGDLESAVLVCSPLAGAAFAKAGEDEAGALGGYVLGIPFVTSTHMAGSVIGLVDVGQVILAEDGVGLDTSTHASVTASASGTGPATLVSLWQSNLVGVRAIQYINWALNPAAEGAAVFVDDAAAIVGALGKPTAQPAQPKAKRA